MLPCFKQILELRKLVIDLRASLSLRSLKPLQRWFSPRTIVDFQKKPGAWWSCCSNLTSSETLWLEKSQSIGCGFMLHAAWLSCTGYSAKCYGSCLLLPIEIVWSFRKGKPPEELFPRPWLSSVSQAGQLLFSCYSEGPASQETDYSS